MIDFVYLMWFRWRKVEENIDEKFENLKKWFKYLLCNEVVWRCNGKMETQLVKYWKIMKSHLGYIKIVLNPA